MASSTVSVQQILFAFVFFSFCLSTDNAAAQKMPAKYCGVWKVVSSTLDGDEQTLPQIGIGGMNGECDLLEIIIQGNRMVQVKSACDALVCETKVLGAVRGSDGQPLLNIDCWQIHRSDEEHMRALMSAKDDRLIIAFYPPDTDVTEISDDAGDGQWVLKMKRRNADD